LHTAFLARPAEYGPHQHEDFEAEAGIEVAAHDLIELAAVLA
jgi:hypothetical protein